MGSITRIVAALLVAVSIFALFSAPMINGQVSGRTITGASHLAFASPTPLFTQCPAIGNDTGCAILIVFNADGTINTLGDPNQGPYDEVEDTLVGVQNNLIVPLSKMNVSGANIFGFDGDGLCAGQFGTGREFVPPPGCPFGTTSYEGPGTTFSVIDQNNGTVIFTGKGLASGASTYFSLESIIHPGQITVSNSELLSNVTLIKHIEGGQASLSNFTLMLDGHAVTNGTLSAVTASQQQNITESYNPASLASMYKPAYSDDCTDGIISSEKVTAGANLICTITNTFIPQNYTVTTSSTPTGTVSSSDSQIDTVTIHAVNGTSGTFDINGTLSGPQGTFTSSKATILASTFPASANITALTNGGGSTLTITHPGMYCWNVNVTSSGNYNSTLHRLIGSNENNECFTIPTPIVQPTVTVIKKIDGGSATLSDFTLMLNGSTIVNGTANTVSIGVQQNVSEVSLPNYTARYTGDCDSAGIIDASKVIAGSNLECTITNTFLAPPPPAPTVTIIKHIVGGTATLANFTLTLNGTAITNGTTTTVTAGVQQNVSEIFDPATLKNQYNTTFSSICEDGVIRSADVVAGANLVCTITNTLVHHNFTVSTLSMPAGIVSSIISRPNDTVTIIDTNGTLASYYVNGTLSGPQGKFNSSTVEVQASQFPVSVNITTATGTTISEPGQYCWDVYVARNQSSIASGVQLPPPNNSECFTIVSPPPVQPTVTVIKHIVGGTATYPANFTLTLNGQALNNGTSTQVSIGQQQNISESYNPSTLANQYTATFSGDCNDVGVINATKVTEGANLACKITNTFNVQPVAPTVTVIKHIIGGSAVLSDFTLMLNGSTIVNGTANTVSAGVQQNVSESSLANYVGTFAGDCDANGVIAASKVVDGVSLQCIITNTFHAPPKAPTVTVIEHILGGPANNFTLLLNGQPVSNGTATPVNAGEQQNVSESANSLYTATFTGDCNANGIINATLVVDGANLVCTITNTFNQQSFTISTLATPAGTVTVSPTLANDTVTITGKTGLSGNYTITAKLMNMTSTVRTITTHLVSSTYPASTTLGLQLPSNSIGTYCWNVSVNETSGNYLSRSVIEIGNTTNNECFTIQSPAVQPTVTVIKYIVGGTATIQNIALMLNGQIVLNGTANNVISGQQQNISESYSPSSLSSQYSTAFSGDCDANGSINASIVVSGANLECIIINTFIPPPPQTLDCSTAVPSQGILWPPNHKFVSITIMGIAPNGSPISLTITGIHQNEPVNDKGDGNTSPDGTGVGTNIAHVRAERAGTGDGRVYHISFTASSGGSHCTGSVAVIVPHDMSGKRVPSADTPTPIDSTGVVANGNGHGKGNGNKH